MTEYEKLKNIIKDKKILYIPIYSCFDYQTGNLNFKADGNINRFLSTFYHCNNYKNLTILYPPNGNDIEWFENICKNYLKNIKLLKCKYIVKSAKIERSIDFAKTIYYNFEEDFSEYDYIIVESQQLFMQLYLYVCLDHCLEMPSLIYWCPVCATNNKTRDFLESYKELDKLIFTLASYTILASDDQVKYYKEITNSNSSYIQIDTLIDRDLPLFNYDVDEKTLELFSTYENYYKIYLPFRLTDKGYQMQEIFDYLYSYKGTKSIKVFYSNPNNCDIYQFTKNDSYKKLFIDETFINTSKDRDTYYTIIDYCNVIIPYFEDTDFICHASVNEFKFGNCVVCKNLQEFKSILN